MTALLVIGIIIAYILASVYFGAINHKIQRRRCDNSIDHSSYSCGHMFAAIFGYMFWWVILPCTLLYELVVGRLGAPAKPPRETWQQRKLRRESEKKKLADATTERLKAESAMLEAELGYKQLVDLTTDGRGFPTKDFSKS